MKNNNKRYTKSALNIAIICGAILSNSAYADADLTTSDPASIAASAENAPGEGKIQAFDNDQYSKWLTFNPTGWLSYDFGRSVLISKYTLTSANDAPGRDPKNWVLQGSTDGVEWIDIDSRVGESFAARHDQKNYSVNNPQAFEKIRFNVTQNNGANLLQLAELEFIGSETGEPSGPLPFNDSASLAINEWQHYGPFSSSNNIIATTAGSGDADLYMRKGEASTTKHSDCKSISPNANEQCTLTGNDIYVSVHGYSATSYDIEITEDGSPDDIWTAPQVDFRDMNPETEGSALVNRILGNPAQHMANRCIDVAKVLYTDASESSRFNHLTFQLRAKDDSGNEFVAYKYGQDGSGEMTIVVSTTHLENVYRSSGGSDSAIRDEIDGILFHEVTHGYNNSPLTTDQYGEAGPFWAYTEGIADGVRINAGFHKTRQPDVNGSRQWLGGYTTSGFFLHYVNEKIDPSFIRKFNQSASDMGNYTWSWDAAFRSITNRGVQDVWNEYKAFINNGGQLDY
ncbi:MAG: discoidin domain-containing protein [Colwellia sp.]|nr:discoidin domain-containing protein [Colwellia sp.]